MCAWVPLLAPGLGTFFVLFFQLLFWDSGPVRGGKLSRVSEAVQLQAAADLPPPAPPPWTPQASANGMNRRKLGARRDYYGVLQLQRDASLAEKWDPARSEV